MAKIKQNLNNDIKAKMLLLGIKQWQVAKEIGITPYTLCGWLRYELSEERLNRIENAIAKLSKGGCENVGKSHIDNKGNC